jgi:X-X-X-Leu-X-X-Gly heptad repeat protein
MGFNSSGQEFDIRKHGNALITGAISGVALGLAMAQGSQVPADQLTSGQYIFGTLLIFLSAVGIDKLRSNTSQMVTGVKSLRTGKGKTETAPATPAPATISTTVPPNPATTTTTTTGPPP